MWRKFRRHHLAIGGGSVLALLFTMSLFAEFFTPYSVERRFANHHPPSRIRLVADSGRFPVRAVRVRHHFAARSRDVREGVRRGPSRPLPDPLVRGRRALPPAGADPGAGAPVRRRRAGRRVPVRHLRHRPRRVLAHPVRGAHVDADRPGRRVPDLRHRRHARRHFGLLRRARRHADPARHRVPDVDSHHPAVARPERGAAAGLVDPADLLRHRGDPVAGGYGAGWHAWCAASCWSCAPSTT